MENLPTLMTRDAAVKEAQRLADEKGIYMFVLYDADSAPNPNDPAFFPATLDDLKRSQDAFLLAAGFSPRK